MLRIFISIFFLSIQFAGNSQLPTLQWAKTFDEANIWNYSTYSNGRTVGVDQQGNVYSAGLFTYTVDFDPGPAVYTLTGAGPFEYGIYISKLNADGNFVWAKQIPVLVEFGDIELKIDNAGNIYLTSELRNAADMDPGPGVQLMTPIGAKDVFVIKLNTDGNLVWVKQFGGPGDTVPKPNILDLDQNNNVIVCGLFNNTVDFDPGPNTYNLTSTAHMQSFITKLNSNGDLIWAKQFGNSPVVYSGSTILDVKCDAQGNIFTVGGFAGTCDFDPGTGVFNLTASSVTDGFIAKLNTDGNFVWTKRIGNTSTYYNYLIISRGIDIDNMNNVVTTGTFIGTYDFDPGAGDYSISSLSNYDSYILKLNGQGDFIWVKIIGGNDSDSGHDVVVDSDDNIYTIGGYGPSVDFDPGLGDYTINSPYYGASVLVKLNSNGSFVYAAPFQSISYGTSLFRRMAIDASRNIYVTGFMAGIVDFDPGPNVYPLDGSSHQAPFVVKLSRCLNITTSTLSINTCNSFTLNNETFDSSGTYIQTIPNSTGCDSIITLNLTINRKFTEQTKSICEGESFFAGGANQTASGTYIDTLQTVLGCDSIVTTRLTVNPKPIPKLGPDKDMCSNIQLTVTPGSFTSYLWQDMSTQNNFTVTASGTYWVTVTNNNNCSATDSLVINTVLPPSNFLKDADSICSYDRLTLKPLGNYNSYYWSTGTTQNNLVINAPGQYWLRVTDATGCVGTDTITIYPKQCMIGVYIPTGFTPNGDGKNETFKALVFGKVQSFKLQIFDRSGSLIFQTTDPDKGWDGMYKGRSYTTTTFVWQCFYQLENEQPAYQKGTLILIR
jgi:gliding motility-associated-like protein